MKGQTLQRGQKPSHGNASQEDALTHSRISSLKATQLIFDGNKQGSFKF